MAAPRPAVGASPVLGVCCGVACHGDSIVRFMDHWVPIGNLADGHYHDCEVGNENKAVVVQFQIGVEEVTNSGGRRLGEDDGNKGEVFLL